MIANLISRDHDFDNTNLSNNDFRPGLPAPS